MIDRFRRAGRLALVTAAVTLLTAAVAATASAQTVTGKVVDETGGALPGVTIEARSNQGAAFVTVTDATGRYQIDVDRMPARFDLTFSLINFAPVSRRLDVETDATVRVDVTMHLALNADVTVAGKRTFANLADAEHPAEDLIGIAQSASQGAITARQLDARPMMRTGEVLETVPGLVISQHSGEGKANQYYLRGFNLDHGTDFATTIAGMPANMPTHAHGQGYTDLNFLIPELVSGVQYSKGPYFAEQGDFATAGAANINYVTTLDRPIVRIGGGDEGFGRVLVAASHATTASSRVLGALEVGHDDGPWTNPARFRTINSVLRYSDGDAVNGWSLTGMAYHATWRATDQIPARAVAAASIGRFGALDASDGGDTSRVSGAFEWQRTHGRSSTKVTAYAIGYSLDLFSNFTFFLDDPVHGDQFEQADQRVVTGGRVTHRRIGRWLGRETQHTVGLQLRNDDIANVALYHTERRERLSTTRQDAVVETSAAMFAQNETAWTRWLRTIAGIRVDEYRFSVAPGDRDASRSAVAGLASPKAGAIVGPFAGTEFYVNAGSGFHSNDARTVVSNEVASGASPTPLARAIGSELGVRTVALPHLHSSLSVWQLRMDSELVFAGDAGTTEAARPSRRSGIEWANYFTPRPWLILDADVSWSRARFVDADSGDRIPGAIESAIAAGITVDSMHRAFGSIRARYFGPRPLVEDNSVRSKATTLLNAEAGYKLSPRLRVSVDVFNLLNAADSDIDYFYRSRLPGEPSAGVDDVHFHPTLPRTARLNLVVGF